MDVDYTLGRTDEGKSTLEVVERFVAVFPEYNQNRGMRRSIPDSYLGVPLNPRFVSITDGEGSPRAAEVDREDGTFTMTSRADEFVHGEQTYVFTYTLRERHPVLRRTPGSTSSTGTSTGPSGRSRSAASPRPLHVDDDLAASLTGASACYRGFAGRRQPLHDRSDGCRAGRNGRLRRRRRGAAVPDHDDRGGLRAGHVRRVRQLLPGIAVGLAAEPRRACGARWSRVGLRHPGAAPAR